MHFGEPVAVPPVFPFVSAIAAHIGHRSGDINRYGGNYGVAVGVGVFDAMGVSLAV